MATEYDIKGTNGADLNAFITYKSATGGAIDLNNNTAEMQVRGSQFSENPVVTVGFTLANFDVGDTVSFSVGATLEVGEGKFGNAALFTGGPDVGFPNRPTGGHFLAEGLDHIEQSNSDVYNLSFFLKINPVTFEITRRRIATTKDWTMIGYSFTGPESLWIFVYYRGDDGTVNSNNNIFLGSAGSSDLLDGEYHFIQLRGGGGLTLAAKIGNNTAQSVRSGYEASPDFIGDDGLLKLGGATAGPYTDPATADDFSALGTNFVTDSAFRGNFDGFQIRNLGPSPANDGFIDPPTTAPSSGVTFNNFDVDGTTFDASLFRFGTGDFQRSDDTGFGGSGGLVLNRNLEAETTTGGIAINLNQSTMSSITAGNYFYDLKLTDTNDETTRLIQGRFKVDK